MRFLLFLIGILMSTTSFAAISILHSVPASGGQCNGRIVIQATGDAGPFDIIINGALYQNDISGIEIIQGLCSGEYVVEIVNIYQCTTTLEVDLKDCPGEITIDDIENGITMPSACGVDDGLFEFAHGTTITGGTAPYETILYDSNENEIPSTGPGQWDDLSHGNHHFQITDANGCQVIIEFSLEGDDLEALVESYPECEHTSDGEIQIQAYNPADIGSFGQTVYNYQWSNGMAFQTNEVVSLSNLAAGQYTVTISDLNGECEYIEMVEVIGLFSEVPLSVDAFVKNTCFNENNGTIILDVSGGTSDAYHSIVWNNGQKGTHRYLLSEGEYSVTVTDYCGNQVIENYAIESFPDLVATLEDIDHICPEESEGSIDITATGDAPFSYEWFASDNLWPPLTTNQDLMNQPEGTYLLKLYDKNECRVEKTYDIFASSLDDITADIEGSCEQLPEGIGSIKLNINTPFPPYSVQWEHENATSNKIDELDVGTYDVSVTDDECVYNLAFDVPQETYMVDYGFQCWETVQCGNAGSTIWRSIQSVELDNFCRVEVFCENAQTWHSDPGTITVQYIKGIVDDDNDIYRCEKKTFCTIDWFFIEPTGGSQWTIQVEKELLSHDQNHPIEWVHKGLGESPCPDDQHLYHIICGDKFVDYDCKQFALTDTIEHTFIEQEKGEIFKRTKLLAYPSPFTDSFNVEIESDHSGIYDLMIFDQLGQEVYGIQIFVIEGENKVSLDNLQLNAGIYRVVVLSPDSIQSINIVKV